MNMCITWKRVVITLAVLISLISSRADAQAPPGVFADQNHPSGPPDPTKLDAIWQVDPLTGSLSVTIQFPTTPEGGRGPRVPFSLHYNSSSTVTLQTNGNAVVPGVGSGLIGVSSVPQITENFLWAAGSINPPATPLGPWTTSGPYQHTSTSVVPNQDYTVNPGEGNQITYNYGNGCNIIGPYIFVDESGGSHDMNLIWNNNVQSNMSPPCQDAYGAESLYGGISSSTDGSALETSTNFNGSIGTSVNGSYPTVVYPDGTQFYGGLLEDSNGNQAWLRLTGSTYSAIDSLGRTAFSTTVPVAYVGQIPAGTYNVTTTGPNGSESYSVMFQTTSLGSFTMPHPSGNSEMHDLGFCLATLTCATNFSASQVTSGQPHSSLPALSSITLPNSTQYTFAYDQLYGTLSQINFPTGGYVRFKWGIRSDGGGYGQFYYLSTLVVTDVYLSTGSGTEDHWAYSFPAYSAGLTSTVNAPDGSYTTYSGVPMIYGAVSQFQMGAAPSWKVASEVHYNSGGSIVKSIATSWNTAWGSPYAGLPVLVTTTLYGGSTPEQQQTHYTYDSYANVIEKDESDFYGCSTCATPSTPPNGWARETFTSYYYWTTRHIVNKPSEVLVTDGSGHPYSLVLYYYDETLPGGSTGYVGHDDGNFGLSFQGPRGNLTTEKRCQTLASSTTVTPTTAASACSAWLMTTHAYDLTGQVLSTTDPNGNLTSFSYSDSYSGSSPSSPTNGYVTQVTHPYGYSDQYSYFYSSGQLASHSDWNSQTTKYYYSDPLNRLTETVYPDTGNVQITYTDSAPPSVTVATATGETAPSITRKTLYDGLGRVSQSQLTTDPNLTDYVDTSYDGNGRVYSVSNPYRSGDSEVYTVYSSYDGVDRPLTITNPDGSAKNYTYASNVVSTTDENLNQWSRASNGLGQLMSVLEPSGTSHQPTLDTDYTYDPLGNLLSAKQWGGPKGSAPSNGPIYRSYAYNGASWLIAANNPESSSSASPASQACPGTPAGTVWTTCYGYDSNGNLTSKIDNRQITTIYTHDALNRLMSKTFSSDSGSTPFSCYQYGTTTNTTGNLVGRLMNAWTQRPLSSCPAALPSSGYLTLRSIAAYDAMGRIKNEIQCTPANCSSGSKYNPTYTYDLAGLLSTYTNGITSTPTVGTLTFTNSYDGAGHLLTARSNWNDTTHPMSIFSAQVPQSMPCSTPNVTYAAFGGLMNATYGNGVTVNRNYNSREWTSCEIDAGSTTTATGGSTTLLISGAEQSK